MTITQKTRPVLVTGSHRSGSTWVGQVLSQAKELGYMHEPFNPIYPSVGSAPIDIWYLYIGAHNASVYQGYFSEVFRWKYHPIQRLADANSAFKFKMWLKYQKIYLSNRWGGKTPLMKDPIAFFSAPWLAGTFNMQVVALIRHPAAFVYSLKRKDWKFPFHHLQSQPELIQDWLKPFEGEISEFAKGQKDIIAQACLFWRILYGTLIQFQKQFPDWKYLRHEDISLHPLQEFEKLFGDLGLTYTPAIASYILKTSHSENPSGTVSNEEALERDSAANIKYWKDKLTEMELMSIMEQTLDIWPSFYKETDW